MVRLFALGLCLLGGAFAQPGGSWKGTLRDQAGRPVSGARIELRGTAAAEARTGSDGGFAFDRLAPGSYTLGVRTASGVATASVPVAIAADAVRKDSLRLTGDGGVAVVAPAEAGAESAGGEQLSGRQVSALPLNKRDFSQLLLLAAGTRTDTNGAANFTQQFTVNGQRGTATVFSLDGADVTDPEMGGATFSNFNVDAIQEINSSAGVLPASLGHGAAGYTEIVSKSGANDFHGSVFEFVRNAAFDARNFFDRRSVAQPGRIPPFNRHEFGVTNGGALRRDRTFYFAQYQGFRQVLGTTQVLPVPTAEERLGRDSTAFPGDVLTVPVDPRMQAVLARYPLPNDPGGAYGARTYAISSKIRTVTDQFSGRVDHTLSPKARLFARFSLNNVDGPLTNPSQTAIDPSFAIPFFDHQRSVALSYERTVNPNLILHTTLGYVRSTPNFPTINHTQAALNFADGLYEGFNTPAGSVIGAYGNLFQLRQDVAWTRGAHAWKFGAEIRVNRDSTIFGTAPNGAYTFGGGAAYSPVEIRSRSGLHDIHRGDLLPDTLSGLLTATPFSYTVTAAPLLFAQGERMGDSAVRREAYEFYAQDTWKASAKVAVTYGLRYAVSTPIKEGRKRTSGIVFEDGSGRRVDPETPGAQAHFLINNQPPYGMDWNGWGPRVGIDWRLSEHTLWRAGGAIVTQLPNLWQDNSVTGSLPYVVAPLVTASPGRPVPFQNAPLKLTLPAVYTPGGQPVYAGGNSAEVPANTEMDVLRYERDLAALSGSQQVQPITIGAMDPNFRSGYIGTYTAGVEQKIGDLTASADYVATVGIRLARLEYPNGYSGGDPAFAPYTLFDAAGQADGGYGPFTLIASHSHSSFHSLQAALGKSSLRAGLGFQASYTFSKSLDDTSSVLGGFLTGSSGTVLQTTPQNPRDRRGEKGPSTFDVTHAFSLSAIQQLPLDRAGWLRPLGGRFASGWQLLGIVAVASGSPFTVYSGMQQTGLGSNNADRPDQVGTPVLSTGRAIREDYFGLGGNNASLFRIPVGVPGGTGPNRGRFGTLGRNTFRGPAFRNLDVSLVKDTPVGPARNRERAVMEVRAEVFNIFNTVNFGLPANIVTGPGFGVISRTAGPSRQIQLSLKLLY
ncbi:MAG: carboxypeptidase regulatory-like domain-containing protein [Acidobacteria bacterium]|nr:carboxypeptidase regulatory-like domain-containing protein [Acidobacteriota bacterium]